MRAGAAILLLLLAALLVWWRAVDGAPATSPPAAEDADTAAAPVDGAALKGRDAAPAKSPPVEVLDHRTWTLDLRVVKRTGRAFFSPDWKEARADASFIGKPVRVELRRGAQVRVLARAKLDDNGRARFVLPALGKLGPLARLGSRLHVVPESDALQLLTPPGHHFGSDGYQLGSAKLPGRLPDGDVLIRMMLMAAHGGVVTGEVVMADGTPAAHAHVWAYGYDKAEASDTCTGPDGRFAIGVSTGGKFNLWINAMDGSAWGATDVQLRDDAPRDLGRIVLKEEHTYAGRVTYADGTPVVGLPMTGHWVHLDMHVSYGAPNLSCETYGTGRATRTDEDGRWRMHLTQPSEKVLCSIHADVPGNARVRELEGPVLAQTKVRTDVRGILEGQRIDIVVQDAEGLPLPDARVEFRRADKAKEGKHRPRDANVRTRSGPDGRATVWLTHGSRWTVDTILDGTVPDHRSLTIAAEGNRRTVEITLAPEEPGTSLEVRLLDPDGAELVPAVVQVRTASGAQLFHRRVDAQPLRFVVPGGRRYHVEARAIAAAAHARGRQHWLPVKQTVEVTRGETARVDLRTGPAAHLSVKLRVADGTPRQDLPHHPEVRLTHEASGRTLEAFVGSLMFETESQAIVRYELEPGTWTVVLAEHGFQTVTKRVELEAGVLGSLEFLLEPLDR